MPIPLLDDAATVVRARMDANRLRQPHLAVLMDALRAAPREHLEAILTDIAAADYAGRTAYDGDALNSAEADLTDALAPLDGLIPEHLEFETLEADAAYAAIRAWAATQGSDLPARMPAAV